ncbi:MAG: SusC/RagA family TonB-linked outer membrane protein [Dysgonomonas sp.]
MNKYILIICFIFLSTSIVSAQDTKVIHGTISDASNGETLIGAFIREKDSQNGVVSNIDGQYNLEIKGNAITVSYLGYTTQEIAIKASGQYDIKMSQNNVMEELIVVGYQAMKKRDVLGAVGKVGDKELVKVPTGSAVEALQGRMSGVNVSSVNGAPGSGVSIRVRGVGSINSSNEPLYIIDGIASENGLDAISPNDIENISVLKDASASIYGARATNGVVIVTTKSGQRGKIKVSYNAQIGFQTHPSLPKMVNTQDYITLYNEARAADDPTTRPYLNGSYLENLSNTDHLASIFQTALIQTHEISVAGGSEKFRYLFSGTFYDQDGIIKNSGNQKGNVRTNLTYQPISKVTVGLNLLGARNVSTYIPSSGDGYGSSEGGSVIRYAFFRNPAVPIYDALGQFVDKPSEYFGNSVYDTFFGDGYPPLGIINNTNRKRTDNIFNGSANVNVELMKNLNWKTVYGLIYTDGSYKQQNLTWGTADRINNPENISLEDYSRLEWTFNSVLNYNKTLDEVHNFNALLGTEAVYKGLSGNTTNTSVGVGDVYTVYKKKESIMSFFGSVNYNYNQKYFASALIRHDGSSKFTKDNRWGNFFSVYGGWNIDSEEFVRNLNVFDVLKLRAGYGTMGNEGIDANARYKIIRPNYNYPLGGESNDGYAVSKLGNEDLTWETSKQFNVGLDMEFF